MASGSTIRRGATRATRLAPELARILVAARGDRTRRELAESLGVTPGTLSDLELAKANPTLAYLERVGEAYGVRIRLVVDPQED